DVPPAEKDRCARTLIALSDRLGLEFAQSFLGETVEVLVENRHRRSGLLTGLTDNYLRVQFEGREQWRGQLVPVRVLSAGEDGTVSGVQVFGCSGVQVRQSRAAPVHDDPNT